MTGTPGCAAAASATARPRKWAEAKAGGCPQPGV
jgi:hypothetical protein